jgi:hypothetical protein
MVPHIGPNHECSKAEHVQTRADEEILHTLHDPPVYAFTLRTPGDLYNNIPNQEHVGTLRAELLQ